MTTYVNTALAERLIEGRGSNSDLSQCFIWSTSPQGHDYWRNRADYLYMGKPLSKTARRHIQRLLNAHNKSL